MAPGVVLRAGGGVELAVLLALLILVGACAVVARRADVSGGATPLFLAYVAGALAAVLLLHACLGRSDVEVSSYALTLVVGSIVGCSILISRLRSLGLSESLVYAVLLGGFVAALVSSRLVHALSEMASSGSWADWRAQLLDRRRAGLSVFGAIGAAIAYLAVLLRRHPEAPASRVLDACASPLGLVVAMGRGGCLLAGCCYGAATRPGLLTLPARVFAPGSPAGAEYARDPEAHIWATQPLEGLVVLAIAVMCERLYRRRQRLGLPDGAVFAIGAAVYGVARTLLEMLRADSPRSVAGVFSVYQVLGVALFAGATAWMVRAFRTRKTTLAAMS